MQFPANKILCILYSSGGIGDVGRHAVKVALEASPDRKIRVLTEDPKTLLDETHWNCGCGEAHSFSPVELDRLDVRAVDVTKDDLRPHLDNVGAVISALGNRQIYSGHQVGARGTQNLVQAMEACKIRRLVAVTSVGLSEDWPPLEFHWLGGLLRWMFTWTRCHVDLQGVETAIQSAPSSSLDYLLVRPVGLSEARRPRGVWFVQKKKGEDKVGPDMGKMDCARFVVSEVMQPTYSRQGVVVGSDWESFDLKDSKEAL
jgi:NAD(P)H-binding